MPDLTQSLGGQDLGYLQIVADLWGLEFSATDFRQGLETIVPLLSDPQLANEVANALPDEAQQALLELLRGNGRMSFAQFTRRYGEIREMGAGRRDRDRPYREPKSTAEVLWYRGLIGRKFFDTRDGLEEFAYLPDEFLSIFSSGQPDSPQVYGRAALPAETKVPFPVSDRVLDDACTLLAAIRARIPGEEIPLSTYVGPYPLTVIALKQLLRAVGLLDETGRPKPQETGQFLQAARGEALAQLAAAWRTADDFNELALLPGLILEGEWRSNPRRARHAILEFLGNIPDNTWWDIDAFVSGVKKYSPDFQRPAGDYDSWFIRLVENGEYLRGFEHWGEVDGELIRFMLMGPLHWLGILDLASPDHDLPVAAFRFSQWVPMLLQGEDPGDFTAEDDKIHLKSDATLRISRRVPRAVRYQLARFSLWEDYDNEVYHYRLTPSSLERAAQSGLQINQLLNMLDDNAVLVPPTLVAALRQWDQLGGQARIEQVFILRVKSPEILQELRASRVARFLGDPLGPTTVIVNPGARQKVLDSLAEMGYLGEIIPE